MLDDHWSSIRDRIAQQFMILEEGVGELEGVPESTVEFLEFDAPIGRVRLERVTKPRTLGERAIGSRRIGGSTTVQKEYDVEDRVRFLRAKRWDDRTQTWQEINADHFS